MTVEYEDGKPVRLDCVVVSCQHEEEKDLRILEKEIREKVLLPALRLLPPDENTRILINPSGRFVQAGRQMRIRRFISIRPGDLSLAGWMRIPG